MEGVLKQNLSKVRKAPQKEYDDFRKYFAFACVDLLIFNGKSVLLTKRTRNPYKGYWHLPGSMIHKTETMQDAAKRSAKEELNLDIKIKKFVGVYESLHAFRHDVSNGFIVSVIGGKMKTDFQSIDVRFFQRLPRRILPHHKLMIQDALKADL